MEPPREESDERRGEKCHHESDGARAPHAREMLHVRVGGKVHAGKYLLIIRLFDDVSHIAANICGKPFTGTCRYDLFVWVAPPKPKRDNALRPVLTFRASVASAASAGLSPGAQPAQDDALRFCGARRYDNQDT